MCIRETCPQALGTMYIICSFFDDVEHCETDALLGVQALGSVAFAYSFSFILLEITVRSHANMRAQWVCRLRTLAQCCSDCE